MNRDAVERGGVEAPYAFVIPAGQERDQRLVEILQYGGVEVHRSPDTLRFDGRVVDSGAWVVRADQPFRPFVMEMLGRTEYPRVVQNGEQVRPYDVTAWRLGAMLGVDVFEVRDFAALEGFALDPAERLLVEPERWLPPSLRSADGRIEAPRIAIYSPWGGSMDEGWTRLVLQRYGFPHERIRPGNPELDSVTDGRRLRQRFDVLLIPSIRTSELQDGREGNGMPRLGDAVWPAEFRRGMGPASGKALRAFAESGGRIVAISESTPWLIDAMGLPAAAGGGRNADAYAPGTLLRVVLDDESPLCIGMPGEVSAYYANGYAYEPLAWPRQTEVAGVYAKRDLLVAGFLDGERALEGRPAILRVPVGDGEVVLFGFHPQRRAQTEGTFGLLFNALWPDPR
jgi:hypothetical protein